MINRAASSVRSARCSDYILTSDPESELRLSTVTSVQYHAGVATVPSKLLYLLPTRAGSGPDSNPAALISKVGSTYFPEIRQISTSSYLSYFLTYFHAFFHAYFVHILCTFCCIFLCIFAVFLAYFQKAVLIMAHMWCIVCLLPAYFANCVCVCACVCARAGVCVSEAPLSDSLTRNWTQTSPREIELISRV